VQSFVPDAVNRQKKNQSQNVVQNATAKMSPSPCIVTSAESSYKLSGFSFKVQGLKYRDRRWEDQKM